MTSTPPGDAMIARLVRVLESFDAGRPVQSASDIARRTGLPMPTAHRIARDMTAAGLLDRDDEGGLRIGLRLWELTTRGSRALGLREAAMPFMRDVQDAVREHTQLGVRDGDAVLFLERLSDRDAVSNLARVAGRLPLHASSSGLVLLAFAPADVQERVLAGPLPAIGPATVTDPRALRRQLAGIRTVGSAQAPGSVEGVSTGIAVPVRDGVGLSAPVVAALGVVLPRTADGATIGADAALRALQRAAGGLSAALGDARDPYR